MKQKKCLSREKTYRCASHALCPGRSWGARAAAQSLGKEFLAMLGGSARSRTKSASLSPAGAPVHSRNRRAQYPWLIPAVVGRDSRSISSAMAEGKGHRRGAKIWRCWWDGRTDLLSKAWTVYERPYLIGDETKGPARYDSKETARNHRGVASPSRLITVGGTGLGPGSRRFRRRLFVNF